MMTWTLREKTKEEIQKIVDEDRYYSRLVKGIGKGTSEICPLEVSMANGQTKDVWELTEKEIYNLICKTSSEYDAGNRDEKRTKWAFQILDCWKDKHPAASPRMTIELIKLGDKAKTPGGREIVRDSMGTLTSKCMNDAVVVAKYLNGMQGNMKAPTEAQIMQVLENMANMQEMTNSQNR